MATMPVMFISVSSTSGTQEIDEIDQGHAHRHGAGGDDRMHRYAAAPRVLQHGGVAAPGQQYSMREAV